MKFVCRDSKLYFPMTGSIKSYDKLPAQVYELQCVPMEGFSLSVYTDKFELVDRMYGTASQKVDHIIKGFITASNSMGVIMSGDKGLGKTLSAKLLCNKMIERGYPVILITSRPKGLVQFLHNLNQECVILFDEFDKVFYYIEGEDSQEDLLSMFDGCDDTRKLYLLTCNRLHKISHYLLNRPGRLHYHIRFGYPSTEEIQEYLFENVYDEYKDGISSVISFAKRASLNYDCLRAIAFELNLGLKFKDFIDDLNILHTDDVRYKIVLELSNGQKVSNWTTLDMFDNDLIEVGGFWYKNVECCISFIPADLRPLTGSYYSLDNVVFEWLDNNEFKDVTLSKLFIQRSYDSHSFRGLI